jgi:ABC-type multidrug transport system fused ATPase/permease subunit
MKQYVAILNNRTLVALFISIVTPILAYHYNINYNIDLTLISIAIVFPLVFSIRSSFRRREKALEHLSQFRASLKTVGYFFSNSKALNTEKQKEINAILEEISETFIYHLSNEDENTKHLDTVLEKVHAFILENNDILTKSAKDKVFRFMQDVHDAVENALAIHAHRTPISLKAYCLIFIYIFPLIYTPTIINKVGLGTTIWITYFVVILSQFILITLYNIQDHMEYPFDKKGLDDIKLDNFKITR